MLYVCTQTAYIYTYMLFSCASELGGTPPPGNINLPYGRRHCGTIRQPASSAAVCDDSTRVRRKTQHTEWECERERQSGRGGKE